MTISHHRPTPLIIIFFLLLTTILLTGCQSTREHINDCKTGDWTKIGYKDGQGGRNQNFAERKEFCDSVGSDKEKVDALARYQDGWTQGNWDLWSATGNADGRKGMQQSNVERHAINMSEKKENAPINRPAYDAGWLIGNAEYWENWGKRDGTAGMPQRQQEARNAEANAKNIRFDQTAYIRGWQIGNRTFWQDAGFEDARNGVPDSQLKTRAAAAQAMGVTVQEEAYHAAWEGEIPHYWTNLGTQDAVSGRDFAMRKAEAQRKGLRIFETEYRTSWENRLAAYWSQAGDEDGYGQPFQLENRMNNAVRDGVFVIGRTRQLYTSAWEAQNAKYCNVDNGFTLGRSNSPMAIEVCSLAQQGAIKRAYLSGQDYEVLAVKYARADAEKEALRHRVGDTRRKLDRLEREIRSNLDNKQRVVNEETTQQDKRRERERSELSDDLRHSERQLDEARHHVERYSDQMQRLRRDIYLN